MIHLNLLIVLILTSLKSTNLQRVPMPTISTTTTTTQFPFEVNEYN